MVKIIHHNQINNITPTTTPTPSLKKLLDNTVFEYQSINNNSYNIENNLKKLKYIIVYGTTSYTK